VKSWRLEGLEQLVSTRTQREGLKERPRPQQPLLLAPRSFLITALDFKGSLAQVSVPVAVEAGVVED
jgi:hypothetical protein